MYTNANSVVGKINELRQRSDGFHVVGVTETWATEQVTDADLHMEGFHMYRVDREGKKGGGVIMYVWEGLNSSLCTRMMAYKFDESVWCNVNTESGNILLGLCYRSPSSSVNNNDNLLYLFREASKQPGMKHVHVFGDFNYPEIDYNNLTVYASDEAASTKFFDTTDELFWTQHVTEPTRCRDGQQPSTLDYVFTDDGGLVDQIRYQTPMGRSDHVVLQWDLQLRATASAFNHNRLNYWKGNYVEINKAIEAVNWSKELAGRSVNDMWNMLRKIIIDLEKKHIPVETQRKYKKNHWIARDTINWIKKRNEAWRAYRRYSSGRSFDLYKRLRNKVTSMIRKDEMEYNNRIIMGFKGKPKKFYGHMRKLQAVKPGVSALKQESGQLTASDQETVEVLGRNFQKMFTSEGDMGPQHSSQDSETKFNSDSVKLDRDSVRLKLLQLVPEKSAGPDNIHPALLKNCAESLAGPLSIIFNESYITGAIPDDWKTAHIVPIYKKGAKSDPANYRPVSLTSVVCKVMESLIKDQLMKYLQDNNIISDSQHGFVSGKSCLTNLLETLESWTKALDEGFGIDVLYLDYRKAFDSVPHKRLLEKLKANGIGSKTRAWLETFLTGRKMRVGIRDSFSQWFTVLSGVPQGSILGPLLFLLFVNELPDWIVNNMKMFADDTKLWTQIRTQDDSLTLQHDLDTLSAWSDKWLLKFNPEKCKLMHIGHKIDTKYFMEEGGRRVEIQAVTEEKDLGVYFTNNLRPNKQCLKSAAKARSVLAMVRRHFKRIDPQSFRLLYKTYIRPHLEFCIQSWSPYLKKDIEILEKIQRMATRLVPQLRKYSYEGRLRRLQLTTLYQRRTRGDLIETYKLLTGKEKVSSDQFFKLYVSGHNTRGHSLKLAVQRSRLDLRKSFFSQRIIQQWNDLPQYVVDAPSTNSFKSRLDNFMEMGIKGDA
jgi:hypothetical protein